MKRKSMHVMLNAGLLVMIAGAATAGVAPTVDGILDGAYGPPVAVQGAGVIDFQPEVAMEIAAGSDQSNQAGKGEYFDGGTESEPDESDPDLVTSGQEYAIKISELPGAGQGGIIKIAGLVSLGSGTISNQVFGGVPGDPDDLGEARTLDFSDEMLFPGDQFISVSTTPSTQAAVIDGRRDTSMAEMTAYGANLQLITTGSSRRSNQNDPASRGFSGGTEIDGIYAYVYDNATPMDTNDDILYLMIAGNISSDFDWFHMFFDVIPGGQNPIERTNSGQSFDVLIRWGENLDGTNPQDGGVIGPGLTFDVGFTADYWMKLSNGNGNEGMGIGPDTFLDSATILSGVAGIGTFEGNQISLVGPSPIEAIIADSADPAAVVYDVDNENSPASAAPNDGGVGGRVQLPGGGSQPDDSDPATVQTGTELKITLEGLGIDPMNPPASIGIAGIILGNQWDFMSNQAIGGLTSMSFPDPANLGFPARSTDFNEWDGDQFVTIPVPGMIPAAPAGAVCDGSLASSGAETSAYGAALWVNTTNASNFENSIFDPMADPVDGFPGPDRSIGSEFNAIYAYIANDPTNSDKPTLFVMVTGNLHDFNKLVLFFDSIVGEGQNDIRGDNSAPGTNFNGGLGGPNGFTFDAGFAPDRAFTYEIGWNDTDMQAEHFANVIQLNTDGGGFGGSAGGGAKSGAADCIVGAVVPRIGLGNNTKTPLNEGSPDFFDRSVLADGTELDALYMTVDGGVLYVFLAGNLRDDFTKVNLFFDTINGGQNTLIFDDADPNTMDYEGNPPGDFSILNRMGGPVLDQDMNVLNNGLTFDVGFDPDFYIGYSYGDFVQFIPEFGDPIDCDGSGLIRANFAKLRLPGDDPGPVPLERFRFFGQVINDSFFGPTVFTDGDESENTNAAALHNGNLGGVDGGMDYFDTDGTGTDPALVATGLELAIDISDIEWNGFSNMRMLVFVSSSDGGTTANQFLPGICANELGETRDVDLTCFEGDQFVTFPNATPLPVACEAPVCCPGNATKDPGGQVNFGDITAILSNWLDPKAGLFGGGSVGDANCDGSINFADITSVLSNWLGACP